MERFAKLILSLLLSSLAFAQNTPAPDPVDLLEQAKVLLRPGQGKPYDGGYLRTVALLREANTIWEASPGNNPAYAESLDLLAIMLRRFGKDINAWRQEAAPLVSRALEIREALAGDRPSEDLALALELQADVLGHEDAGTSAGAPYWQRGFDIRGQRVRDVEQLVRVANQLPPLGPSGPVLRVSIPGGVSPPSLVTRIDPQYPQIARLAKIACTVRLGIVVNAQGRAQNFQLIRSCGYGMDEKAAEAVTQWKFKPGEKDDQPVAVRATIEVNFRLL